MAQHQAGNWYYISDGHSQWEIGRQPDGNWYHITMDAGGHLQWGPRAAVSIGGYDLSRMAQHPDGNWYYITVDAEGHSQWEIQQQQDGNWYYVTMDAGGHREWGPRAAGSTDDQPEEGCCVVS
ncbi:hypothetical protein GGX14DRAFT_566839 [Mycena pura]|uniref:Uncharacterized protein n=1 Tax=Mycena pura TaxID=153505 RepID=A0AAD6VFW2_9AGAR|nr:hypothetical protein GGX14DRAFT_566839 [Mycena pura]